MSTYYLPAGTEVLVRKSGQGLEQRRKHKTRVRLDLDAGSIQRADGICTIEHDGWIIEVRAGLVCRQSTESPKFADLPNDYDSYRKWTPEDEIRRRRGGRR